jgi:lipopolysaccharide cholinephosphotransferase
MNEPKYKTDYGILFPDERERGQTRLRQCQLVMLRMLKIVDHLCGKHGIEYFLVGGSLLGAVRHKGFIPWDDDLDIGMTRTNYERFCRLAVPELPHDLFFQTPENDPYFPACHIVEAKIRDKYSSYIRAEGQKQKWHNGIMLDIFVYDRAFLPHNFFIYAMNRALIFFLQHKGNKSRAGVLKGIARFSPVPLVWASSYLNNLGMVKLGTNFIRQRELERLERMAFEDMQVSVPAGWHQCLKRQYGTYMRLPPVEQQRGHHSAELPDPFTPCNHPHILHWNQRKNVHVNSN